MQYNAPPGSLDPDAPYVNGTPGQVKGSPVNAHALEYPQREIINVIKAAGLTPTNNKLDQLLLAIHRFIADALPEVPDKYDLGQYYWYQDYCPRAGMLNCMGGLVTTFSRVYPQMVEYLQTSYGRERCVSQAEYDELHTAVWHTAADGTKFGWNGIGGVNKFVWDQVADTLRLPDLRGMSPEMVGDGLGVGDVHGWGMPSITGSFKVAGTSAPGMDGATGVFVGSGSNTYYANTYASGSHTKYMNIDTARGMPAANKVQTSAVGMLACVYLGRPTS